MWAGKVLHAALVLILLVGDVRSNWFGRLPAITKFGPKSKNSVQPSNQTRSLLPQLPPHDDTCYLLEFVSDGSDHCAQMEPVVQRLERDLRTKVRKIHINRKQEFLKLYDCVGGNECGTVPFFYNRRTGQAICGATPYQNLKNLAMGKPFHFFHDAPQTLNEKVENDPRRQRGVGLADFVAEKLFSGSTSTASKKDGKDSKSSVYKRRK